MVNGHSPASSIQRRASIKSPQEFALDAIPPVKKYGSMAQKTVVQAQSVVLTSAGSRVRPLAGNLRSSPQLFWGEAFAPYGESAVLARRCPGVAFMSHSPPATCRCLLLDTGVE